MAYCNSNLIAGGNSGNIFLYGFDSSAFSVRFSGNRIGTWLYSSGIFNQDLRITNTPGFEWTKGSGSFAVFTTGLCVAGYYNGELREIMGSYKGECYPGYITDSSGIPVARNDLRFRFYKVNHGDNANTNPDWFNWSGFQ